MLKLRVPETLVEIVRSFHDNMKASVRVDGELLEDFEVTNGLRQGCTMAPPLFNFSCLPVLLLRGGRKEFRRLLTDIGTLMLHKQDNQLFLRSSRNANQVLLQKRELADDVVLLACQEMLHALLSEFMWK